MNERQERGIEFVIACKYPAKPFEFLKEAFYQMPFLVGVPGVHGGVRLWIRLLPYLPVFSPPLAL